MPSTSDLYRTHADTDNFLRQLDDLLGASQTTGKNKPRLDAKTAQNRFSDLAKQIQGLAITNPNNEEFKALNQLTGGLADERSFARSLGALRKNYASYKAQRDKLLSDKTDMLGGIDEQLKNDAKNVLAANKELETTAETFKKEVSKEESLQGYNQLSQTFKQSILKRNDKLKSLQAKLEKKDISLKEMQDVRDEIDKIAKTGKSETEAFKKKSADLLEKTKRSEKRASGKIADGDKATATEEEETEVNEERNTEATREEEATEEKPTAETQVQELKEIDQEWDRLLATAATEAIKPSPVVQAGTAAVATAGTIAATRSRQPQASAQTTADASQITFEQPTVQVNVPAQTEIQATIEVTPPQITVQTGGTVEAQITPATPPSSQVAVTAQVESKIERAAAARNIPISGQVTATTTLETAVATGVTAAVEWFDAHQNLTPEQVVTQARQEISTRSARETEATFINRDELARAKAENIGFSRGISQQMAARGRQTGDQKWTQAAQNISTFAETTARQTATHLETPGAARTGNVFWQPEELAAIDQEWEALEKKPAPPTTAQAPAATTATRGTPSGGNTPETVQTAGVPGRAPRPTPRSGKLPPGVTLAHEPLRLPTAPAAAPGSGRAATAEGAGGDTTLSDQSIGSSGEEQKPSVLEQAVPLSRGTFAQGETVGMPIAGEEIPETFGGGVMGEQVSAMELEAARTREMMRTQALIAQGAAAAETGMRAVAWTTSNPYSHEQLPDEEDWDQEEEEEGEEDGAGGVVDSAKQALDRAKQMAEDKIKEKVEQEVKKQVEKMIQKATQKAAQQTASAGVRVGTEVAEGATSEFIVPLIILIIQMNLQLLAKYLLKAGKTMGLDAEEMASENVGEGAGKTASVLQGFLEQSFIEDIITIFIDCNLVCGTNPCCWILGIILIVIIVVLAGTDTDVQSMLGTMIGVGK